MAEEKPQDRRERLVRLGTEQVALAIGCPEWTSPEGCDRLHHRRGEPGECFCQKAAEKVLSIQDKDLANIICDAIIIGLAQAMEKKA